MSVLGNVINWILGLGAAIFVPIIIIIAGLMRLFQVLCKHKKLI